MLGDLRGDFAQIDHLAALHPGHRRIGQIGIALSAGAGHMVDDLSDIASVVPVDPGWPPARSMASRSQRSIFTIRHRPVTRRPITSERTADTCALGRPTTPAGACSHGQPSSQVRSPPDDTVTAVFESDLRHFLDLPDDVPAPARPMAEHLSLIVRAATAGDAGLRWVSALRCGRPPGRQPCPGHVAVLRIDVPPSVEWQCTSCGDEGVISGWEHSPFDLRGHTMDFARPGDDVELVIDDQVAATLRSLTLIDSTGERLVFRARPSEHGIVLRGNEDDVDELIGYVAAEANREPDRRRQKPLDAAFEMLNDALDRVQHS